MTKSPQEQDDITAIHGNFCGFYARGDGGTPEDELDEACRRHDESYGVEEGFWDADPDRDYDRVKADMYLLKKSVKSIFQAKNGHDLEVRLKMSVASVLFLSFSLKKFILSNTLAMVHNFFSLLGIKLW